MAVSHLADLTAVLTADELSSIRSMVSDPTITDVYVRTESDVYGFDGHDDDGKKTTTTLVEAGSLEPAAHRLGVALDRIGHQGSPRFRATLATAFAKGER